MSSPAQELDPNAVPFDINEIIDNLAIENGRLRTQLLVSQARTRSLMAKLAEAGITLDDAAPEEKSLPEPKAKRR